MHIRTVWVEKLTSTRPLLGREERERERGEIEGK